MTETNNIFNVTETAGKKDNKTHREYEFIVEEEIEGIKIIFSYFPKTIVSLKDILDAFKNGIESINKSPEVALKEFKEKGFRLTNLLSLALYKDGKFLGAAHKHNNEQEFIFRKNSSPPGFLKTQNVSGRYKLIISMHGVFTDGLKYSISVGKADEKKS